MLHFFDHYRQFYKLPSDIAAAGEFLKARLLNEESVIFYVRNESEALGFIQLYPAFSSLSMKRLWILNDLFVAPKFRKNSIGRLLLERASEFSRETNARGMTLRTALDNHAAQQLYETSGWKRDQKFCCYDLAT